VVLEVINNRIAILKIGFVYIAAAVLITRRRMILM